MKEYKQIDVRAIDLEALGVQIAYVNTDSPARKEACRKNAHLIAAAEDLLEFALFVARGVEQGHIKAKQFLDFSDANAESLQPQTIGGLAKKVISKATGSQS